MSHGSQKATRKTDLRQAANLLFQNTNGISIALQSLKNTFYGAIGSGEMSGCEMIITSACGAQVLIALSTHSIFRFGSDTQRHLLANVFVHLMLRLAMRFARFFLKHLRVTLITYSQVPTRIVNVIVKRIWLGLQSMVDFVFIAVVFTFTHTFACEMPGMTAEEIELDLESESKAARVKRSKSFIVVDVVWGWEGVCTLLLGGVFGKR